MIFLKIMKLFRPAFKKHYCKCRAYSKRRKYIIEEADIRTKRNIF